MPQQKWCCIKLVSKVYHCDLKIKDKKWSTIFTSFINDKLSIILKDKILDKLWIWSYILKLPLMYKSKFPHDK